MLSPAHRPCRLTMQRLFSLLLVCTLGLVKATPALAALAASVTIAPGSPTSIYPGQTTILRIMLSNDNATNPINNVAFANSLPGTLPDGLRVAGPTSYTCFNPATSSTSPGSGTLTATIGAQAISLSGGVIPARAGSVDGTCTIDIPVTAGTSTGNTASYIYTIVNGAVTGNDGAAVANSGAVSQSVNVNALTRPTIAKSFGASTLVLGGSPTTLTITLTNPNPVPISGFSVTDVFPQLGGLGIIRVAAPPNATASCNNGGAAPSFSPAAGSTSIGATGTLPARVGTTNGRCTLTVQVVANHTNGAYSTGAQNNTINASSQFTNDIGIPAAANATAPITVRSPLRVTKSVAANSMATGTTNTFTITFFNDGNTPLTINSFTDSPIDGIVGTGFGLVASSVATTCSGGTASVVSGGDGVTLTGGSIPASGSCTLSILFTGTVQTPNTPSSYTNSLPAGAVNVGDPAIVSQATSASVTVYETFHVTKSISHTNPAPGEPVRYQVTVQNWSAAALNNVTVNDNLTHGQTYLTGVIGANNYTPSLSGAGCSGLTTANTTGHTSLSFTIGTIPARVSSTSPSSCAITFWVMAFPAAAPNYNFANRIHPGDACYNPGGGPVCNGSLASITGNVSPWTWGVTKAFAAPTTRPEGTVTRMTLTLSNLSANPLTNLAISDTLPTSGGNQLQIANPANAASTCGSPTITAVPGSTSLSLNGGTVPARAAGGTGAAGSCTVEVDVVGGQAPTPTRPRLPPRVCALTAAPIRSILRPTRQRSLTPLPCPPASSSAR